MNEDLIELFYELCLLNASQCHDQVFFLLLLEMQQKLSTQILYNSLPRFWAKYYILIYTHHQELIEVSGK